MQPVLPSGAARQVEPRLGKNCAGAYDAGMKHDVIEVPPSQQVVDAAMIAEARAGYASGYGVDHAVVSAWLRTWGTAAASEPPECHD